MMMIEPDDTTQMTNVDNDDNDLSQKIKDGRKQEAAEDAHV